MFHHNDIIHVKCPEKKSKSNNMWNYYLDQRFQIKPMRDMACTSCTGVCKCKLSNIIQKEHNFRERCQKNCDTERRLWESG